MELITLTCSVGDKSSQQMYYPFNFKGLKYTPSLQLTISRLKALKHTYTGYLLNFTSYLSLLLNHYKTFGDPLQNLLFNPLTPNYSV